MCSLGNWRKSFIIVIKNKKKNPPSKFYKSSVNKSFFNKKIIFEIINRQNIDNKIFYWIKNKQTQKKK